MFMETSAKAGHNVKSLFKKIAMSLVGMEKDNEVAEQQNTSAFRVVRRTRRMLIIFNQKSTLQRRPTLTYLTPRSVHADALSLQM